jgi:hypothetical protein
LAIPKTRDAKSLIALMAEVWEFAQSRDVSGEQTVRHKRFEGENENEKAIDIYPLDSCCGAFPDGYPGDQESPEHDSGRYCYRKAESCP